MTSVSNLNAPADPCIQDAGSPTRSDVAEEKEKEK